jgi:hypothetical protein
MVQNFSKFQGSRNGVARIQRHALVLCVILVTLGALASCGSWSIDQTYLGFDKGAPVEAYYVSIEVFAGGKWIGPKDFAMLRVPGDSAGTLQLSADAVAAGFGLMGSQRIDSIEFIYRRTFGRLSLERETNSGRQELSTIELNQKEWDLLDCGKAKARFASFDSISRPILVQYRRDYKADRPIRVSVDQLRKGQVVRIQVVPKHGDMPCRDTSCARNDFTPDSTVQ